MAHFIWTALFMCKPNPETHILHIQNPDLNEVPQVSKTCLAFHHLDFVLISMAILSEHTANKVLRAGHH